jgi:DNA-directed RNA polymerase specialized sigma24 family protein
LKQSSGTFLANRTNGFYELYDKYAPMLLGYITEVVKDEALAEEYLVRVFNEVSYRFDEITAKGNNTWLQLQLLAKSELSSFFDSLKGCDIPATEFEQYAARNRFIKLMTAEQRAIFCQVYYHGKSTSEIAAHLNCSEQSVRRILREAFSIIRKG